MVRLKSILICASACGILAGGYAWLRPPVAPVAASHEEIARDSEKKAVAEMAKFLEAAPTKQIDAILAAKVPDQSGWDKFAVYTHKVKTGTAIAKLLADNGSQGWEQEGKRILLENPSAGAEDVQSVLADLPDNLPNERATLISFLGEAAARGADRSSIAQTLLRESQRVVSGQRMPSEGSLAPQAVALRTYFGIEADLERRWNAYRASLESQNDPAIREIIARLEPRHSAAGSPPTAVVENPGASIASDTTAPVAPADEPVRDPATQDSSSSADGEMPAQEN